MCRQILTCGIILYGTREMPIVWYSEVHHAWWTAGQIDKMSVLSPVLTGREVSIILGDVTKGGVLHFNS